MLQDARITASSAIATLTEDLLKGREIKTPLDSQSVVSRQIDAITLLGIISSELSFRRKKAQRPSIAHQSIKVPAATLQCQLCFYLGMMYPK